MDAISFVLGIKSSHLRSAHLKDLVYRGRVLKTSKINNDGSTDGPPADGQTNGKGDSDKISRLDPKTAWVMAVYEDDAGDEHKWRRSITNQGASEYRINDRVVTAQAYNEALEAENILIKARNFLVFQGDVEAIASQSPQDLTRLIEQISGSLEYKTEYERLQGEVEQAAENQNFQLHRRRGINSEIKQYQEQKKEAENFQKKTQDRDAAIVTHALWKLYHLQSSMDESTTKIDEHEANLAEFRRNVDAYEKKLDAARKEQSAASREVGKIDKSIKSKEKSIEDMENSLVPINEKVEQSTREVNQLRHRLEDARKDLNEKTKSEEADRQKLKTVEKAQELKENEYRERMKKTGIELSDADRKEYNTLRTQVIAKASANQTKLDNLLRQEKTDKVTVNNLKGKVDTSSATLEKLEGELATINERRTSLEESVKSLSQEVEAKKKEFGETQSVRVRTNRRRTELEEKLADVAKQLSEADDGRRQNDREARMKEMVNTLKRVYPGVKGRIGDLCKPKQKKYDEAVIVALGKEFESVVVDTEKTGLDCVQHLKDQRASPMTFIPLDNIKVNAVISAVKGISGSRLTIDTIDFDSAYERAMAYACGSSVVCDTLDIAKRICYEKKIQVKAVSVDGYVIHKAGLMTGGRGPEQRQGKRRFEENDVESLRKVAGKYRDEIENLPKDDRRAEESLRNDLQVAEPQLQSARRELEHLEKNLRSKEKERDNEQRQVDEWEDKYTDKANDLESIQQTVQKFQAAIYKVQDQVFEGFCKKHGLSDIRKYEAEQEGVQSELEEERKTFEVQKRRILSTLEWTGSVVKDLKTRLANMEKRVARLEQDLQAYQQEKTNIEDKMGDVSDELDALRETLETGQKVLETRSRKVAEAKAEVAKRSKEIDSRQKEINALKTSVQKDGASKFALLRKCKLEQIQIPLISGSLDGLPNEDNLLRQDADAMELDEETDADMMTAALDDYGVEVDYEGLANDLRMVCPHSDRADSHQLTGRAVG